MKKVVIVGAGSGGTLLANLLAHEFHREVGEGQVSVQLVGEGDDHAFQPGNLDIAFKGADPKGVVRPESSLLRKGVTLVTDGAAKVDLKSKVLTTRGGAALAYDHIVFATGAMASPELMPGLREGSLNFHQGPSVASRIWEALQRFEHGKVLVAITRVPHKCPPSPNEAAFMLDEFFRKRGLRESVEIKFLTPYPRAYPAEHISEVIQPMFERRGIELVPFFAADHVDPTARKIYDLEGESEDYDLLIAVPPHQGAEVVRASGIGDEEGWIPADKHTMRVEGHPEAYAIGDATNIAISKSGVVAHLQAEAVAKNLASDLRGGREV
ncbi:MAG: NAD(P)/FAD-dependent oxidoreductase, partial [Nitrososphaerales archaeon]